MKKQHLPLILIIASSILVILNFVFASDELDLGFWMRISSSGLIILAMVITIRDRKQKENIDGKDNKS